MPAEIGILSHIRHRGMIVRELPAWIGGERQ